VNPIEWLEQLSPGVVILSLAAGDSRGLPSPEVADWLQGRSVLRTDRDGWIELITDGERLWVQAERGPDGAGP